MTVFFEELFEIILGPPGFREDQRLSLRAHFGLLREAYFQRLLKREGLAIGPDRLGSLDQRSDFLGLLAQFDRLNDKRIFVGIALCLPFLQQLGLEFLFFEQSFKKVIPNLAFALAEVL